MRRSSGSCARSTGDNAGGRTTRRSGGLFGSGRVGAESAPASLRQKRARTWRGRRGTCRLRAGHEANGALHEAVSTAGIRHAPVWLARCIYRNAKVDGSEFDESCVGTVAIVFGILQFISINGG